MLHRLSHHFRWSANGQQMRICSPLNHAPFVRQITENRRFEWRFLVYTERVGGSSPSAPTIQKPGKPTL
jgi:hypothetical protein